MWVISPILIYATNNSWKVFIETVKLHNRIFLAVRIEKIDSFKANRLYNFSHTIKEEDVSTNTQNTMDFKM